MLSPVQEQQSCRGREASRRYPGPACNPPAARQPQPQPFRARLVGTTCISDGESSGGDPHPAGAILLTGVMQRTPWRGPTSSRLSPTVDSSQDTAREPARPGHVRQGRCLKPVRCSLEVTAPPGTSAEAVALRGMCPGCCVLLPGQRASTRSQGHQAFAICPKAPAPSARLPPYSPSIYESAGPGEPGMSVQQNQHAKGHGA